MHRSHFITLLTTGTLAVAVTGCSIGAAGDNDQSVSDPPVSSGNSESSTPSKPATTAKPQNREAEKLRTATQPPATADHSPSASENRPDPLEALDLNKHGNIVEDVGERSSFTSLKGTNFVGFKAKKLVSDFECPVPDADQAVNGQYVALHFSVNAHRELRQSGWTDFTMSNREFTVWGPDGERVSDPVGNSAGCVADSKLLPSPIAPGDDAAGLIILDVPEGSGAASFRMGGFEGSYGWEWQWQ